jgi:hypothetical protein
MPNTSLALSLSKQTPNAAQMHAMPPSDPMNRPNEKNNLTKPQPRQKLGEMGNNDNNNMAAEPGKTKAKNNSRKKDKPEDAKHNTNSLPKNHLSK